MNQKSPFFVVRNFISPLLCEDIVDTLDFTVPDRDKDGKDIKTIKTNEYLESIIYEKLMVLIPDLQSHYQLSYNGTERIIFEMIPQGSKGEVAAENSSFLRGKWLRTKQRDLTAILFLCDYQDNVQFDTEFEIYGGKLEFPQHNFSFNPNRGTLVIFPSDPHFLNATSTVYVGDAIQARIQIAAKSPFIYDPRLFPGNYTNWFSDESQ
ncbi:2OG-Fe(II) oxygenase [Candidatus Dojkabacteria bacterium]|jgi:hypothetical protein|nr:2OG-Fe(II) oxygenase [Candidatus Dojkabacteria bacterium]